MDNKKFKKIEDLLPEGEHLIRVFPQEVWSDITKSYTKNTIQTGINKNTGQPWYKYKTKVGDEYVGLFAMNENKAYFDRGYIKVNIVPKRMKGVDGDIFVMDENGNPKKALKAFFNPASDIEIQLAMQQYRDGKNNASVKQEPEENDLEIENIPF